MSIPKKLFKLKNCRGFWTRWYCRRLRRIRTITLADDITPGGTLRIVGKGTHGTPCERNITMPQMPFELPAKGPLFTLRDKRWNEQTLLDNIKTACTVAGLKLITIHHLRHCAATYKLAGGMNIYELMQNLGWRSFKIAQQYVDISRTVRNGDYIPDWERSDWTETVRSCCSP